MIKFTSKYKIVKKFKMKASCPVLLNHETSICYKISILLLDSENNAMCIKIPALIVYHNYTPFDLNQLYFLYIFSNV